MYPLKFKPIYKEKIWGGRNIGRKFARKLPAGSIGESWEISCHGDDISEVANGSYAGLSLKELISRHSKDILGQDYDQAPTPDADSNSNADTAPGDIFPLLVKIIDARDNLSVQVHPDDAYAAENEDGASGKTELWYILNAEPGARIIYGLSDDIGREEFIEAVEASRIQETLNEVPVKTGDYFYMPAGTVHAICEGVMLAEIQQTSDLTYRIYDWDRVDADGNSRELHIEKAIDAIDFTRKHQPAQSYSAQGKLAQGKTAQSNSTQDKLTQLKADQSNLLINNPEHQVRHLTSSNFFNVELVNIFRRYAGNTKGRRFYIYMNLGSQVRINYNEGSLRIAKGESFLIPAALGHYEIVGQSRLLKAFIR